MRNHYVRVIIILGINLLVNYLLFYPLGMVKYAESTDPYVFGFVGILVSSITLAITLMFMKFVDRQPIRSMNFRFTRRHLVYSILSIVVTVGLYVVFYFTMSSLGLASFQFTNDYFSNPELFLMLLVTAIAWFVAAFYEEVLFRGYMVVKLRHLPVGKLFLITSIIFSVFHLLRGYDIVSLLIVLLHGILLMYIYLKSESILAVTITHFISNFSNGHLVGSSEVSIMYINQAPADIYQLIPYFLQLILHLAIVNMVFRGNKLKQREELSVYQDNHMTTLS